MADGKDAEEKKTQSGRERWPLGRFAKTVFFFQRPSLRQTIKRAISRPGSSKSECPPELAEGVVLVTGATGGVGKRVVDQLLQKGVKVRALARNKSKALAFLSKGEEPPSGGNLEIVVADIGKPSTLKPSMFKDVTAMVCCHAAIVQPKEGDSPDRAKYYQGIKFFEPEVIDSPEEVDFLGTQKLVEYAMKYGNLQGKVLFSSQPGGKEAWVRQWGALDDVVMGGVSESSIQLVPGAAEESTGARLAAVFSGVVKTSNNGGFASVRTKNFQPPLDFTQYDGIKLRVKGDGNRYKFILRDDPKWDSASWCFSFDTIAGEWIDVKIPMTAFIANFRSGLLKNDKPINLENILSFQLMLSKFEYDGDLNPSFTPGPFSLVLESITAYKDETALPKIVLVGSAGVTRPRRPGIVLEEEPPAVRMNDMLGGILDWKLKGEDAIRESGVPFTVIRPCALTEEPRGAPLEVGQGDSIKGKISRDTVAEIAVAAFLNSDAKNTTFEVKSTVPFSEPWKIDEKNPPTVSDFSDVFSGLKTGINGKELLGTSGP
eukprot:CAMPEP_0117756120 /NCGR_PEP_ID=MMETSP0947-20121206/13865_1 /TAXON_ID=44440 /ORGANISM="Chattonella subsalsa, Strain CCMP2191" /LENGTH=543 /DNA_ID=CAMNT_0005575599 /DNA_START=215 /DNA_END=1846 /DNA_ORIENTATION=-